MKLNHLDMKNKTLMEYLHKPQRNNAIALHKLYDCEKLIVPTSEQILIQHISFSKYMDDFMKELIDPNEDANMEYIELCNFLGINYDGIAPYDPSKHERYDFS